MKCVLAAIPVKRRQLAIQSMATYFPIVRIGRRHFEFIYFSVVGRTPEPITHSIARLAN